MQAELTSVIQQGNWVLARLNEHQKSAEHANDAGHSIDWTSVKIIGQENYLLSRKISTRGHKHS